MPGRDGTGPLGMGQRTGRGYGCCNSDCSEQINRGRRGDNRRRNSLPLERVPVKDELVIRKQQQTELNKQLQAVNDRISELEQE